MSGAPSRQQLRGDLRNSMVFRLPGDAAGARTSPQSNLARRYFKVRYARGSDPFATEYSAFLRRLVAYDAV
jgi:hypothetical protein